MAIRIWLAAVWLSCSASIASAQHAELEAGIGYVFGGGAEDPGPSLRSHSGAMFVRVTERWGVAVRIVDAPGEDLYDRPIVSRDRDWLGKGRLRYCTVTARRRIPLSSRSTVELGFGLT